MNFFVLVLINFLSVQQAIHSLGTQVDPKHELLTEIIGRYRLASRHFRESQSILPFEIQFPIHDVVQLDGSTNQYQFHASIRLDYQLDFLHWASNDTQNRYYNIEDILLPKTTYQSLWLPDIQLADSDSIEFKLESESIKIDRYGRVIWIRRGLFQIYSSIDLTFYPFDRQYLRIKIENNQKTFKLQYQSTSSNLSRKHNYTPRSLNFLTTIFENFQVDNSSDISLQFHSTNQTYNSIYSRGWFVQILGIEPKNINETLSNLNIYLIFQRRRESHIYSTILPTIFFSICIFIFYFSSIESYQRLILNLLNILATFIFLSYLDKKLSIEQLSYTPILIRYLTIVVFLQIFSFIFDHIIHSVYYGGIHFISHWLHRSKDLSLLKYFKRNLHFNHYDPDEQNDYFLRQLIEREEFLHHEDYQIYQWKKQARLSECLCCWFFLFVILIVFILIFFIIPIIKMS